MGHIDTPDGKDEPGTAAAPRLSAGWTARRRRVSGDIEATALRLFADRSYGKVSVEDVAEAAGCSIRTVTRHFPTKEDLLLNYNRRKNQMLLDTFAGIRPTRDPAADIWQAWRRLARRSEGDFPVYALWRAAAATAPEVMDRADGERRRSIQQALATVIATALELDPEDDIRPRMMAATIESANTVIVDFWLRRGCVDDLDALYRTATAEVAPSLWVSDARTAPTSD
ncbi:TetR/AcrR family transcriptional regulator [Streptomyces sp. NPDC055092]|uniref:TetR/AcrR family transcriptional regulator n=1 Tax=Streptomyces sp. NPDC059262 TaxID=3346797 RepID=UPI0036A250CF